MQINRTHHVDVEIHGSYVFADLKTLAIEIGTPFCLTWDVIVPDVIDGEHRDSYGDGERVSDTAVVRFSGNRDDLVQFVDSIKDAAFVLNKA